ncbi:MAG: rhamnose/proton symporter RhaT [Verrucomicrobiae bacterium]|nr:rhamnose/proton symporter RhaT [Verrucomicrobiae bacterium]
MNEIILPLVLVTIASVFQGTFGLGMKYFNPLPWEAWWLVHATVAMLIIPWLWASIVVPDLLGTISQAPRNAVFMSMLFGFLWGIGGIMFGVSVRYVGVSLTYGIVMGLAALMGALIPLLRLPDLGGNPAVLYILTGIVIMLAGVAIVASAGIKRDRVHAALGKEVSGMQQGKAFRIGLAIAITCGLLSSLINVGFANAQPIAKIAEANGALTRNSSLAAWVVVLTGAYLMNVLYSVSLLSKNKTWGSFKTNGAFPAYKWAIIAGLLWFGALGVYGQGSALMGSLGPIIGWPMLLGLSLIVSNIFAVRMGEWADASKPLRTMVAGLAVLIVACCLLGYSNSIPA